MTAECGQEVLSTRALELAELLGLPATYDAHYLALAQREGCANWLDGGRAAMERRAGADAMAALAALVGRAQWTAAIATAVPRYALAPAPLSRQS